MYYVHFAVRYTRDIPLYTTCYKVNSSKPNSWNNLKNIMG